MATANSTANPTTTTGSVGTSSPRSGGDNKQQLNSPQRRAGRTPWTHMFRGGESEGITATPSSPSASTSPPMVMEQVVSVVLASSSSPVPEEESLENGSGSNNNAGKRTAWNKLANGAVEIGGSVMGGSHLWPALSESARASTKLSSDSLKGLSDGSSASSVTQGNTIAPSSPQRQVSNNPNPNSTATHSMPARQRSTKRNGTTTAPNGGTPQPPGSQGAVGEVHLNNPSPRDHAQRSSQSRSTNDHPQQQRNSFRNRNNGPHSRGDGSYHPNYGGRRDQDRANQDWNANRNFSGRDPHWQPQRGVPRFMRHPPPPPPPPPTPSFLPPGPVWPFPSQMVYPDFRAMSFVPAPIPPHTLFAPPPDVQLPSKIVNQIDYYFSSDNLVKDTYLRQNMDDQGWVPVTLIAGFNKVSHLTDNIQLILDALKSSTIVEVQGDKVRRRNDWMRWIITPSVSSSHSIGNSSHDMLASRVQSILLEERTTDRSKEGTAQVGTQGSLDHSTPARNSST